MDTPTLTRVDRPTVKNFNELARALTGDYSWMESRADIANEVKRSYLGSPDEVERGWNTYSGGASGGYLLDYELASEIFDKARSDDGPLNRCTLYKTKKHAFHLPGFEETSRVNGSRWGGIQAYWVGQEDNLSFKTSGTTTAYGATQPSLNMIPFNMQRCIIYSQPFSRDLLDDAPMVESMLRHAAHHELRYALTSAMINGNGIGSPFGIIPSPSSVTVTRKTGGAIASDDIDKMWAHMWPYARRNSCWHANDDTLASIDATFTSFNFPQSYYLPEGANGNKYPLIKGRPLLITEQSPVLGAKGDLTLCSWDQYGLCVYQPENGQSSFEVGYGRPEIRVEQKSSDHLRYDTDEVVYRFKIRADGKSMWRSSLTIADSSQSASAFVVLV